MGRKVGRIEENRKELKLRQRKGVKMRKNNLFKVLILGAMFGMTVFLNGAAKTTNKKEKQEDCYIPKGELTCVTDINTVKGSIKLAEKEAEKDKLFKDAEKYFKKGRFGNENVGFIDYPEGWMMFVDSDSGPSTMQISREGFDIYTLDVLYIVDDSINLTKITEEIVNLKYNALLEAGHTKNNLEIKDVVINGYKGKSVKVKRVSGKSWITYYIPNKKKMHIIVVEGLPQHTDKMQKFVERSWNPYK